MLNAQGFARTNHAKTAEIAALAEGRSQNRHPARIFTVDFVKSQALNRRRQVSESASALPPRCALEKNETCQERE